MQTVSRNTAVIQRMCTTKEALGNEELIFEKLPTFYGKVTMSGST